MSDYGTAAMEFAYERIKAPHWRISEHVAFEQGWKACQAHAEALYAAQGRDTPAKPEGWARCNVNEFHSKSAAYAAGYMNGWDARGGGSRWTRRALT